MARWVEVRLLQADYARAIEALVATGGVLALAYDPNPPSSAPNETPHDTEVQLSVQDLPVRRVAQVLIAAGVNVLAIRSRLDEAMADRFERERGDS